jgi:hypothetical protein
MPATSYTIMPGHITTPWSEDVDPQMPLPEHPRPQMERSDWENLNGLWDYAITKNPLLDPTAFMRKSWYPTPSKVRFPASSGRLTLMNAYGTTENLRSTHHGCFI